MLLARHNCRFGTLTPTLLHLLSVVEEYARFHNLTIVVISATESPDTSNPAHQRGEAIDIRCTDYRGSEKQLLTSLLARLGPEFTGKLGSRFRDAEHLHLQLRPGLRFHAPPVPTHAARFNHGR
jgi:hypothetical protein